MSALRSVDLVTTQNNMQFGSVAEETPVAINESLAELKKDSLFEATATVGDVNEQGYEQMNTSSVLPITHAG